MKVLAIGKGGMGKLFGRVMADEGREINYAGREVSAKDLAESEVIVIAAPASAAESVAKTLQNVSTIDQKLVISLWSHMQKADLALAQLGAPLVHLHFLFGPDIELLADQNIAVAGDYTHKLFTGFEQTLLAQKARIHHTTPEFHDRIMAYTQSLSQYSSIMLGLSLSQSGFSYDELRNYASRTFRLNRYSIERIMRQKPQLWAELQFENQNFPAVLKQYLDNAQHLSQTINTRDEVGFSKQFEDAATFWRTNDRQSVDKIARADSKPTEIKLAALGPEGTNSFEAARQYDTQAVVTAASSIQELIAMARSGCAKRVILPLENSIEGIVSETLDGLYAKGLIIEDDLVLNIHHYLYALERPTSNNQIKTIYSHPQALGQCREYLTEHYPQAQLVATASTAASLRIIIDQKDLQALAIGPDFATEKYDLAVIDRNIEDEPNNQTRFVVCSKEPTSGKKLDFVFVALVPQQDRPGLLHDILQIIKDEDINLSQLDSRPNRTRLGFYMFYARLDISSDDQRFAELVAKIEQKDVTVRRLSA